MKALLNVLEGIFAVIALFFMTGGLRTILAPGSEFDDFDSGGSVAIRLVGLLVSLFAMGLLVLLPNLFYRLWTYRRC